METEVNFKVTRTKTQKITRLYKQLAVIVPFLTLLLLGIFAYYLNKGVNDTRSGAEEKRSNLFKITVKAKEINSHKDLSCLINSNEQDFTGATPYNKVVNSPIYVALIAPSYCQEKVFYKWSNDSSISTTAVVNEFPGTNNTYVIFYK